MAKLRMKERYWRPRWMPTILLPAGEPRPREAQVAQGRLPVHPASGYASPTARAARATVAGAGQAAQAGLE